MHVAFNIKSSIWSIQMCHYQLTFILFLGYFELVFQGLRESLQLSNRVGVRRYSFGGVALDFKSTAQRAFVCFAPTRYG